ncbi:MAG: endonuclease III, partial [Candidatus Omnitrophica bacterium]|nr:endonuclease III [Candidatus Omnitrophota bacterium]
MPIVSPKESLRKTIRLIEKQVKELNVPWLNKVAEDKDPYRILISCILSLRTKDKITAQATQRLFGLASSPKKMLKLSRRQIQDLIYPVGFYRNKAKTILQITKKIVKDFKGKVPRRLEELLELKGVGRKTANLVLGLGYNISAICVDTHVHRISNRLGWIKTKHPYETEEELKKIIPKDYWIRLNSLLVAFGQNI